MTNDVLVDPFSPPKKKEKADGMSDAILGIVKDLGCSYPSEICGMLDVGKETVYRKLRFLEHSGKVKRMLIEDPLIVPDWLKHRVKDLWALGLKGKAIKRMTWYMAVDVDGEEPVDSS